MKKTGKKLLCLLLCIFLMTGCEGSSKGNNKADATPTTGGNPTLTEGASPTVDVTPTPEVDLNSDEALKEQEKFDAYLTDVFKEFVKGQGGATIHFLMEHPENYGIEGDDSLGEVVVDEQGYAEQCKRLREELEKFNYSLLTKSQKVNYDRMDYEYRLGIEGAELTRCYSSLFSMNGNVISNSSTYYTEYMICEKKDADDYLKLLAMYPEMIRETLKQAEQDKADGILPTKAMLENVIDTARDLSKSKDHPFVVAFQTNLGELSDLTVAELENYVKQAQTLVEEKVVPELVSIAEVLEKKVADGEYAEPAGMCNKEGGKEYYEYLIQAKVGSEMSAQEIFDYLEGKKKQMLKSYMAMMMLDSGVIDRYESATYELTEPEAILNELKTTIRDTFPAIGETEFTVSYLPKVLEIDGVLAYYLSPQIDNTGRKVIRVNGSAAGDNSISLYSTLAHEGYPGHLYQDEFFMSSEGYHIVNSLLSYQGYQEGWAVRAGAKAYEWCCSDDNVAACFNFDYDYSMMLAAMSDIGVNYFGWDVDGVYSFLKDNLIDSMEAAESFFDMAVSDPGVYLPYVFGYHMTNDIMKNLEKKGMTEKEAMEAFLTVGPCSFEVLTKHLGLE